MPFRSQHRPVATLAWMAAVVSLALPQFASGQRPSAPVFEAEAALMELEVRVTDRRGTVIPDLERDDFQLSENGQIQEIATFEFVPQHVPPALPSQSVAAVGTASEGTASESDELRRSTFVYIAARGRREDRTRIHSAVTDFIDQNVRPGLLVSIEGSPFTADHSELRSRIDGMLRARSGPNFVDTVAVDLAREFEFSAAAEAALEDLNDDFEDDLEEIADRAALYRRLRMYEYIDLIRALSIFPGRKMVVLFLTGLPVDEDNLDVMKALEDEATRARVRFFVFDVSGLSASAPGGDAETVLSPTALSGDTSGILFDSIAERRQDNQDGLWELARRTGGRAVLNSNDFGEIFDVVEREAGGYYLLGYYPQDTEQRGRLRRLKVRAGNGSLRVSHQRGYYEERPFETMNRSQKNLRMHQALMFDTPYADLPVRVDYELFRDSAGTSTLVYSVGIHSGDLPSTSGSESAEVRLTVIARAAAIDGAEGPGRGPVIDDRQFRMTVDAEAFARLRQNPASWLHYGSQMSLGAGTYDWKVIVRDDFSGTLGSYSAEIRIPPTTPAVEASTLLLTGRIEDVSDRRAERSARDVLLVDGSRFFPTAVKSFPRGGAIYVLYDVYGLDDETLASPPNPALALYQGQRRVDPLPVEAFQTVPQPDAGRVRYLAALRSEGLEVGDYTLAALLPVGRGGRKAITRKFQVVEAGAGRPQTDPQPPRQANTSR